MPADQKELTVLGFGGTQQDAYEKEIFPRFEKLYPGTKATFVAATGGGVGASSKIIAERARPTVDVLYIYDIGFLQLKRAGVLSKIDPARVPNLKDVYDLGKDPDGLGAPQGFIPACIEYNTDIFKQKGLTPPTSWLDLWKPEFKGHVGIGTIATSATAGWIPNLAKTLTGDPKNIDAAFAKIKELVQTNNLIISPFYTQMDDLFRQGTLWIAVQQGQTVNALSAQGFPVACAYPKEGVSYLTNQYIIPQNAPHPDLALAFVNYALGQEAEVALAEIGGFSPTNKTVTLKPEIAAKMIYGEENMKKLYQAPWDLITDNLEKWTERWNREIEVK